MLSIQRSGKIYNDGKKYIYDIYDIQKQIQKPIAHELRTLVMSGETALFPAARNNHYKLVRMLIRAKSDIKTTNNAGLTVVDVAAETKEMDGRGKERKKESGERMRREGGIVINKNVPYNYTVVPPGGLTKSQIVGLRPPN